jgi:outer membrane lipoprotein SlyB
MTVVNEQEPWRMTAVKLPTPQGNTAAMKTIATLLAVAALTLAANAADAKGCLKGAVVGGVAGHYAHHHGVIGAIAGCAYGRHRAREQAKQQETPAPAGIGPRM